MIAEGERRAEPIADEDFGPAGDTSPIAAYLLALRHRTASFFIVALITAIAGVATLSTAERAYESTARVLVTPVPSNDRTLIGLPLPRAIGEPQRSVATAAALVRTPEAAELLAKQDGGGASAAQILESVEVVPSEDSNILEVTATMPSAEAAAGRANDFINAAFAIRQRQLQPLIEQELDNVEEQLAGDPPAETESELRARATGLRTLLGAPDPTLSIAAEAEVPESATGSGLASSAITIALAAIVFGAIAAVVSEALSVGRVRNEPQLLAMLPYPILARVVRSLDDQREKPAYFPSELDTTSRQAIRALRSQLALRSAAAGLPDEPRRIVIVSPDQRDGRTWVAVNLATEIAAGGGSAVLVDADLRSPSINESLGLDPTGDISAFLWSRQPIRDATSMLERIPDLKVIAGLAQLDLEVAQQLSTDLPRILGALSNTDSEWIVVDTSPLGLIADSMPALGGAMVVVVTRIGSTRSELVRAMRERLELAGVVPVGQVVIGSAAGRRSSS